MALDQARDQAEALASSTKSEQHGAGRVALRGADRLLHRGAPIVERPRAGQLLEVLQQARLEAGERVQLVGGDAVS